MAQENYVAPNVTTSGAVFADLQAGSLAGIVAKVVAANTTVTPPASQATVAPTGGGATLGLLPAGVYFVSYTYSDGAGETTIGSSRSASFTVGAGNKPRVTFNDTPPTGAVFRNIYLTVAGGASGTENLYITGIAVATTTVDLLYAGPTYSGTALPTANSTGAASMLGRINAGAAGNLQLLYVRLSDILSQFDSGQAVDYQMTRTYIRHIRYVLAVYRQALDDILTLIAANPGSLHTNQGATVPKTTRTFP